MKRFLIILSLLMAVLTLTAAADDLITSPAPGNLLISPAPDEDRKALIESLHKSIIPITPDTTYDEFMSYMEVVDNSDGKIRHLPPCYRDIFLRKYDGDRDIQPIHNQG